MFKEMIAALSGREGIELSLVTNFSERSNAPNDRLFEEFTEGLDHVVLTKSLGNYNYNWLIFHPNSLLLRSAAKKLCRTQPVDILHLGSVNATLFAPFFGGGPSSRRCKIVRHLFSFMHYRSNKLSTPLYRATYARFVDGLFVTSRSIRRELDKLHIDKNKVFCVPPIVDTDFFKPSQGLASSQAFFPNILYLGSVAPERFPKSIIDALYNVKMSGLNPLLTVVGRYPFERQWMTKLSARAETLGIQDNLQVQIRALTEDDKRSLYHAADIVLLPFTGLVGATQPPLVLLEAMSCGTIVIGTRKQDIPDVVKHGENGMLIDNLSPDHVSTVMLDALDSKRSEHIAKNARRTILNDFAADRIVDRMLTAYSRILNEGGE
jgi:glycosyltransferase involved in cell wall biosynthesis